MTYGILAALLFLAILFFFFYNKLVRLKNRAAGSWSDIDVQLKKRYDLIPQLVAAVKGYAAHERQLFEAVTEARSSALQSGTAAAASSTVPFLNASLSRLYVIIEQYPQLKADSSFLDLQNKLSGVENSIESARRYYNAVVRDYNSLIQSFPVNLIAAPFGFRSEEFFELENPETERLAPNASLS